MDLQAFRDETRDWLDSNCPKSMRIGAVHFEDAYELYQTDEALEWRDRAATRGWAPSACATPAAMRAALPGVVGIEAKTYL